MNFDEAYKNLNAAQKEAVDAIDGPVLVIAGPGTGKTQLLSTRVANILKKTDADASSILCLTFTNKAATNMRERLQLLTDGEAAHVHIKTFHSFASEIMNSYSEYFWNGASLTSAPDAVQYAILESIFDSLPLDNPYASKFYGKYTKLDRAKKGIARAKEAGLTPDKLRVLLQTNLTYIDAIEPQFVQAVSSPVGRKRLQDLQDAINSLPSQPTDMATTPIISLDTKIKESLAFAISLDEPTTKASHTSKWKSSWITTENGTKGMHPERRRNQDWLHLADIYEKYRDQLHQRGFYDYSDMLLEVIVQIEQNEALRAEIQERFNYVLIDEFQDSNSAQLRLAHLIADHPSAEGRPNIMAVGDDDQSIYGFNGAEINNMLHFERTYGKNVVKTIVLQENYRSTNEILKTAASIIECSEDRLVNRIANLTKNLNAKAKDLPNGTITHRRYQTIEHQHYMVAYDVKDYFASHKNESVAILARSHKSLEALAAHLNNLDVPIKYERQQNILDQEIVEQIINVCRAILAINQGDEDSLNVSLSKMLPHPMFQVDEELLWQIAKENRRDPQWLASLQDHQSTQPIAKWLYWLAKEANHQPLPVLLENIMGLRQSSEHQAYIREYFISDHQLTNLYLETLSAIRILRNMASEFSIKQNPSIVDFLEFIATEQANNQVLANYIGLNEGNRVVDLLSVHKAKGLEFDAVFIIDAIEKDWKPSGKRHSAPANLPLQPPLETSDEYARLMYVAATRAKHTLIINSYLKDSSGEEVLASPLIRSVPEEVVPLPDSDQSMAILERALIWPRIEITKEEEILAPVISNFTLNATNLITFLDVTEGGPSNFLEKCLLRLPQSKSDSMSHGTAMHAALEHGQKLMNLDKFDLKEVKTAYKKAIEKEAIPLERLPLLIEQGEKNLERLFTTYHYQLPKGSQPELGLFNLSINNIPIAGKLDRIDYVDKNSIQIVDYKTGSGLSSLFTKDKTKEVKAWKHKLQLTFYAILARAHPELSKYKAVSGQMVYIEVDDIKKLQASYQPSEEEIERLTKVIQAVWQKVQNYDLPDTTHYEPTLAGIKAFEQDLLGSE